MPQTILSLQPGDMLVGRYKLVEHVGSGGMGVVWKAIDTHLDRPVAIKTLPTLLVTDRAAIARLKDEARRCLDLSHPNIIRLYTFEQDQTRAGLAMLVMEYISGRTLGDILADFPDGLAAETVERIGRAVGAALEYAHNQQPAILHRDIKPTNIMVTGEVKGGLLPHDARILLMDYGIGHEVRTSMTRVTAGKFDSSGSPSYMSPRAIQGKEPSKADDLWSLGVTLYELLSGQLPFPGSGMPLMFQITSQPAPALKKGPSELRTAIMGMLEKEDGNRARFEDGPRATPIAVSTTQQNPPAPPSQVVGAGAIVYPSPNSFPRKDIIELTNQAILANPSVKVTSTYALTGALGFAPSCWPLPLPAYGRGKNADPEAWLTFWFEVATDNTLGLHLSLMPLHDQQLRMRIFERLTRDPQEFGLGPEEIKNNPRVPTQWVLMAQREIFSLANWPVQPVDAKERIDEAISAHAARFAGVGAAIAPLLNESPSSVVAVPQRVKDPLPVPPSSNKDIIELTNQAILANPSVKVTSTYAPTGALSFAPSCWPLPLPPFGRGKDADPEAWLTLWFEVEAATGNTLCLYLELMPLGDQQLRMRIFERLTRDPQEFGLGPEEIKNNPRVPTQWVLMARREIFSLANWPVQPVDAKERIDEAISAHAARFAGVGAAIAPLLNESPSSVVAVPQRVKDPLPVPTASNDAILSTTPLSPAPNPPPRALNRLMFGLVVIFVIFLIILILYLSGGIR